MNQSIFGRPINSTIVGGLHIGIDVITTHKGKIVLFGKHASNPASQDLGDLWFPWDLLNFGEDPYAAAKRILKDWGKVEPEDIKLVNVLSNVPPSEDWNLTFQYVAELKAPARVGKDVKIIKIIERAQLPRIVGRLRRSEIKDLLELGEKM